MFAQAPQRANLEPENSGISLIETPQLPKNAFVLFMQQNSVQRALEAGLSSQFQDVRRARLCAQVLR